MARSRMRGLLLALALAAAEPAAFEPATQPLPSRVDYAPTPSIAPPAGSSAQAYDIHNNHWALGPLDRQGNRMLLVLPAQSPGAWVPDHLSNLPAGPWRFLQADEHGYLWIASANTLRRMDPRYPARGWADASHSLDGAEITAMAAGPSGAVLAALKLGKVVEVDLGDGPAAGSTISAFPAPTSVTRLITDAEGAIWAVAAGKRYRKPPPQDAWQQRWELVARLPGGNHDLSGDVNGDNFYMAGGQTANWGYPATPHVFDDVFEFSGRTRQWRVACKLRHPRFYNGTAVLNGKVWVIGGNTRDSAGKAHDLATVEICDPATGERHDGPELPLNLGMPLAVHIGGRVYVAGAPLGAPTESPLKLLSISATESRWRSEPDGPHGPKNLTGTVYDGKFYIAMPRKGLLVFNPSDGSWQTVESPLQPRSCQMAAHRREIWLMGGRDVPAGDRTLIYDPGTGTWRMGPDLPRELAWGAAAELEGRLIVTGGAAGRCYSNRTFILREFNRLPGRP